MTARAITLADVAREAGTSASTASRALSGRAYVAPHVKKRRLATADRNVEGKAALLLSCLGKFYAGGV